MSISRKYEVEYSFHDSPEKKHTGIIAIGDSENVSEQEDEEIFFYCDSEEEFTNFINQTDVPDFIIHSYKEIKAKIFDVYIDGGGTRREIAESLRRLADDLLNEDRENYDFEDPCLCGEIEEE